MGYYKGITNNEYTTEASPFAGGGEGDIYNIIGNSGYVAKIYKTDKRTTERERKLTVMVSNQPSVMEQYAWPIDVLYENGRFVGYVMPKVVGKEKLRNLYVYDKRKGKPWSLYIAIAKNLAAAVYNVHEIHQVIGDLNPENILVNPQNGMVTLVDTDSYHISDAGKTYRCGVGMPEFVAPELQGIHFPSAPLPTFTPASDRFALSVLIFALLMNGAHPFSCKVISGSSSKFQPIDNMQNGKCAFFSDSRTNNMDIPRYAPDIESLPNNIQKLFKRAFIEGRQTPGVRPTAEEWYNALEQLESNLKTCLKNSQHIHYYGANECPWCKVEEKMRSISQSAFSSSSQSSSSVSTAYRGVSANSNNNTSSTSSGVNVTSQYSPSQYTYTPSNNSNNTPSPTKTGQSHGWIWAVVIIVALFFIIKSCSDNSSNDSYSTNTTSNSVNTTSNVEPQINYVEDQWLTDLEYLKKSSGLQVCNATVGETNTGVEYEHYLSPFIFGDEIVYDLKGNYDRLSAIWTITSTRKDTDEDNYFEIYADDRLIYSSPVLTGGSAPVDVSVNISGCKILTILFIAAPDAELGDILLTTNSSKIPNETPSNVGTLSCWLTELEYFNKSSGNVWDADGTYEGFGTNVGGSIGHIVYGSAGTDISYYLDGEYSRLTGQWAVADYAKDRDDYSSFEIYADDVLVYSSPTLTRGDVPVDFDVDIQKCTILKIVFTSGEGSAYLCEPRLHVK